ncbi:hypothetical protein ACFL1G_06035 [Planctomycetota bacterium]
MYSVRYFLLLILNVSTAALAGDNITWPCFHGPRRDNLSTDTMLLQSWAEDGPKLLWTASGIGHGYSSVAIVGEHIFTAGMIGKQTYVTSLNLEGKQVWQRLNGQSWEASERQPWAVAVCGLSRNTNCGR